jgi:hypothetical protein
LQVAADQGIAETQNNYGICLQESEDASKKTATTSL